MLKADGPARRCSMEAWDVWFPEADATGLPFARGRLDPTDVLWVHAAPEVLTAHVRDDQERLLAAGESLRREGRRYPMTRLARHGATIAREDRWPRVEDTGGLILL